MNIEKSLDYFNENLHIKIEDILSEKTCQELISKYEEFSVQNPITTISNKIIEECSHLVFKDTLNNLLSEYFQCNYSFLCSSFDVVDSSATQNNYSTRWHLDGGMDKTLKLFIYLNPVSDHGGNTVMINQEVSKKLRKAKKLPLIGEERIEDITPILKEMGEKEEEFSYDLNTGDALLFSPLLLAHKCLPPKSGKKRYTICFTIVQGDIPSQW